MELRKIYVSRSYKWCLGKSENNCNIGSSKYVPRWMTCAENRADCTFQLEVKTVKAAGMGTIQITGDLWSFWLRVIYVGERARKRAEELNSGTNMERSGWLLYMRKTLTFPGFQSFLYCINQEYGLMKSFYLPTALILSWPSFNQSLKSKWHMRNTIRWIRDAFCCVS